jgi:uncharacterized protein
VNDVRSLSGGWVRGLAVSTAQGLIFFIQLYQHMVSPLRLPTCRFMPTCSQYAVDALTEYGLVRGSWLAAMRLAKCGPWHRGGWDPIPERRLVSANFRGTPAKVGERDSVV